MWKLQVLALPLQIHSLKLLLSKTFLRTHAWDNGHCSDISFLHQTDFSHSISLDHKLFLLVFVKASTSFLIMSSLLNLRNPGSVWATWLCKHLKKVTHSYIMYQFIRSSYLYFVISWLYYFVHVGNFKAKYLSVRLEYLHKFSHSICNNFCSIANRNWCSYHF